MIKKEIITISTNESNFNKNLKEKVKCVCS